MYPGLSDDEKSKTKRHVRAWFEIKTPKKKKKKTCRGVVITNTGRRRRPACERAAAADA